MDTVNTNNSKLTCEDKFNWEYCKTKEYGNALICNPVAPDGLPYHYTLIIWNGIWLDYYGRIVDQDGDTIDFSEDNLFDIMGLMQSKAFKLYHE